MTDDILRVGLVGLGRWGRNICRTIQQIDGLALSAVCSRNPDAEALAPPGCLVHDRWQTIVESPGIDGLVVAAPPAAQTEIALAALARGLPLMLEKPLALNVIDAERIRDAARGQGTPVLVDHIYLFHPLFRRLRAEAREAPRVLAVTSIGGADGPVRDDVSVLWDWAPHDVAMALRLLGGPFRVDALTLEAGEGDAPHVCNYRVILVNEAGGKADLRFGNNMPGRVRRVEVSVPGEKLIFDDVDGTLTRQAGEAGEQMIRDSDDRRPLEVLLDEFCLQLRGGEPRSDCLDLGVEVVKTIAEIERCQPSQTPPC